MNFFSNRWAAGIVTGIILLFNGAALGGQDTLLLEAEDAELTGVVVSTATGGYSGSGFVDGFDNSGDQVKFTFTIEPGLYSVLIGYATPYGEKGYELSINGAALGSMFPLSGGKFAEHDAGKIRLGEGENVAVVSKGWGWYYLDYIRFIPAVVSKPLLPPGTLTDADALGSSVEVFEYLLEMYGEKVLSGQQDLADILYIDSVTGKTPAVGVFDLIDYSVSRQEHGAKPASTTEEIIAWQKSTGGLVSLSWHWNAPTDLIDEPGKEWWRGFYTYATTFDLQAALSDTTSWRYRALLRDMDVIANELRKFYNEGIPVLWRPLHEASGGWFWWGAKGSGPYQELWRIMHDRFTRHFGLHNLIWVSTHGNYDWYAGDDYVDIVGLDIYESPESTMSAQWEGDQAHFDGRKLLTLSESGTIPIPQHIIDYGTWWSWFSIWSGSFPRAVGEERLSAVYNDTLIITVDELPEWNWEAPEPLDEFEVTDPDAPLASPPEAGQASFSGDLFVASILTGSYLYSDVNGDEEGESLFQWFVASDPEGSDMRGLEGANQLTYVVADSMREKYVAFQVTPVAATGGTGNLAGDPALSDFRQILVVGTGIKPAGFVKVYPNPVGELLTVDQCGGYASLALIDMTGRVQQFQQIGNENRIELPMTHQEQGVYLLQLHSAQGTSEVIRILK